MLNHREEPSLAESMQQTLARLDSLSGDREELTNLVEGSLNLIWQASSTDRSTCELAGILGSKVASMIIQEFDRNEAEIQLELIFLHLSGLAEINSSLTDVNLEQLKSREQDISPGLRLGLWGCLLSYDVLRGYSTSNRESEWRALESASELLREADNTARHSLGILFPHDNIERDMALRVLSDRVLNSAATFRRAGIWLRADWALGLMQPYFEILTPDQKSSWIKESKLLCSDFEVQATVRFEYEYALSFWGKLRDRCKGLGPDYKAHVVECNAGRLRCAKKFGDTFSIEDARKDLCATLKGEDLAKYTGFIVEIFDAYRYRIRRLSEKTIKPNAPLTKGFWMNIKAVEEEVYKLQAPQDIWQSAWSVELTSQLNLAKINLKLDVAQAVLCEDHASALIYINDCFSLLKQVEPQYENWGNLELEYIKALVRLSEVALQASGFFSSSTTDAKSEGLEFLAEMVEDLHWIDTALSNRGAEGSLEVSRAHISVLSALAKQICFLSHGCANSPLASRVNSEDSNKGVNTIVRAIKICESKLPKLDLNRKKLLDQLYDIGHKISMKNRYFKAAEVFRQWLDRR